jgi:hypothetical protein
MSLSAPAVSAKLKEAGFGVVHTRDREGIRVSRGALAGRVCVSVDFDGIHEGIHTADLLQTWLESNASAQGWAWTRHTGDACLFTLTHKPLPKPEVLSHRAKDMEAANLSSQARAAVARLHGSIYRAEPPAQADITAARTALEALIELAGGAE